MAGRPGLGTALAVVLLLLSAGSAAIGQEVIDPLSAGEPLVLTFRQGRVRLADGVLGYRDDAGKVFLPLGELSRGIGFAIDVDTSARRAEGFYLVPENRFRLDLGAGTVESAGRLFSIEEGSVAIADADLFVEVSTLTEWFHNVDLLYDDTYLLVEVMSDPPVPAVQRLARDSVRTDFAAIQAVPAAGRELEEVAAGYRILGLPVVDVDTNVSWSSTSEKSGSIGLRGVQDLAGMGAQWFLGLDQDMQLRETRITLSRKDPEGRLLGPLGLTEIELGDIGQFGAPLISRGLRGAGVRLTNRPWDVASGTTIELRGELPRGWEVELYRDGILIGFEVEPDKGEYVFPDVALQPGINEFSIVRHGPQGQRDESTRIVRLGGNQPPPGTWYTEVSALLQQRDAVDLADIFSGDEPDALSDDSDLGQAAAEARFVFGVRPGVSLAAACSTVSLDGERLELAGLSSEFSLGRVGLSLDSAVDQKGHVAAGGRIIANVAGAGVLLQHEEFGRRFRSPANRTLLQRSQLRINRRLELPGSGLPLNTLFRSEYERGVTSDPRWELSLGASTSIGEIQLNKELAGTLIGRSGGWHLAELEGSANLSWRRPPLALRGGLSYSLSPEAELKGVSLNASTALRDSRLQFNATLNHKFGEGSVVGLNVGWSLGHAEIAPRLSYSTAGSFSAGIGVSFSLDWGSRNILPRVDRQSRTSQGLAYVQVFIDKDHDGRRSPGDTPIEGVRLTPGSQSSQTDSNGKLVLSGFPELLPTDVMINVATLPDPFLRPSVPGYRVKVRPGAPVDLLFPVTWVSDVEGMVLVREETVGPDGARLGPRTRGLGNVEIVVLNDDGHEVRRLHSEFDGFFAISNLPTGRYRLRIDADQAARFGLDDAGGVEVTLEDDTAVLPGVELRLDSAKTVTVSTPPKKESQ